MGLPIWLGKVTRKIGAAEVLLKYSRTFNNWKYQWHKRKRRGILKLLRQITFLSHQGVKSIIISWSKMHVYWFVVCSENSTDHPPW